MANDLSFIDELMIQSLIKKNTDEEIAEIVGQPVELISEYISRFSSKNNVVSKQSLVDNKARERQTRINEKKIKKEWKTLQERKRKNDEASEAALKREMMIRRQNREVERMNKRKRAQPSYHNKKVDWTKKILVRIDHKTMIYVDPGTDIALIRKKYLDRMNQAKKLITPKAYTEVKKFKPLR